MHAAKELATVSREERGGSGVVGRRLLLLLPQGALSGPASHDPWQLEQVRVDGSTVVNAPGRCETCHTLDPDAGENGTSYISNTARTLRMMKIAKGGSFTLNENFGCTFCHSSQLDNVTMDDVLSDFEFDDDQAPGGAEGRRGDGHDQRVPEHVRQRSADGRAAVQQLPQHGAADLPGHEGRPAGDPAEWTGTWNQATTRTRC